jgi:Domain of unknown function (DUF4263)
MANFYGEKVKANNKSKQTFHFINDDKKINQLSREIHKNKGIEIHYPIGYNGGRKYKNIVQIEFHDFKAKLPTGLIKSFKRGYGFTKVLKIFANYLDNELKISKVVFVKTQDNSIDLSTSSLTFNESTFSSINKAFTDLAKKSTQEQELESKLFLHTLFPKVIKRPTTKYVSNALTTTLSNWGNSIEEFSQKDKEAIKDLFEKLSLNTNFLDPAKLSTTKQYIDNKILSDAIQEFSNLLSATGTIDRLEKKWQAYLKINSWIFSSVFAQPIILFKDEAYVGGKDINNQNGKFSDYLMKNKLSNNVTFLEIKTHKTDLLNPKAYRGTDVFSVTDELSGCINQVLNQRDNFQKEFDHLKRKSKENFETVNSKCIVIIGQHGLLTNDQKHCFELFRNNCRDVEILTFDELLLKIQNILTLRLKK